MHFEPSDEQTQIQEAARAFAERTLAPGYLGRDRETALDRDLCRKMGELGLVAPTLPVEFGGLGMDGVTMGLITEELARGDINVTYLPLLSVLNGQILARHLKAEVAQDYLPRLAAGELLCSLALTEPHTGSDAAKIRLAASHDADNGRYILRGEKTSISLAHQADIAVVFARTGESTGAHGISAFLVPLDSPGIQRTRFDDVGSSVVGRGSIFFDDVAVPEEYLLGTPGAGFTQVMQGFDFSRALIGLMCVGAARASLEETWRHVSTREAFGRALAGFEGVSFPLAEAETRLEALRVLCYKALWLRDNRRPHTAESAMCKWLGPQTAFEIIHQCLLLHGHAGYGKDTPHQQRLRDVMGVEIGDGTAQIMKLIIAREKAGRVAVPY